MSYFNTGDPMLRWAVMAQRLQRAILSDQFNGLYYHCIPNKYSRLYNCNLPNKFNGLHCIPKNTEGYTITVWHKPAKEADMSIVRFPLFFIFTEKQFCTELIILTSMEGDFIINKL